MDINLALSKMQSLCVSSERSERYIREKLQKTEAKLPEIEDIIKNLKEDGYLNEQRYAKAFARDKYRFNKWGLTKIAYHLRSEGISTEAIDTALESINENDYIQTLSKLLSSKLRHIKDSDTYQQRAKLYRYALSKGFSQRDIHKALNEILEKD